MNMFLSMFNELSYNNELYGRLSFHLLLGQLLRHIKIKKGGDYIDPRVSFLLLQPSRTGKSRPYALVNYIGDKCGLNIISPDELTDASLIGTIDEVTKKGKDDDKYTINYGCLKSVDIIHWDEAEILLSANPKKYSQNAIFYFQKALNPLGSKSSEISKKLAHGEWIRVYPKCSLYLTSIMMDKLEKQILEKGICQRLILFPRELTIEEREKNDILDSTKYGTDTLDKIKIQLIIDELNSIKAYYQNIKEITIPSTLQPLIKNKIISFHNVLQQTTDNVRGILQSFVSNYKDIMMILAIHSAALNKRYVVNIDDIVYGYKLSFQLFKYILPWIEDQFRVGRLGSKEKQLYLKAKSVYDKISIKTKDGYVSRLDLIKGLRNEFEKSETTIYKYLSRFLSTNKIIKRGEGKNILYKFVGVK